MRFIRHILGAIFDIDRILDELANGVRLVGAFGAAALMLAKQGELAFVVIGLTCVIWLGIGWISWKRAGSRARDAYGQAEWAGGRDNAERAGLRVSKRRRR
jgi:hypothetical protein